MPEVLNSINSTSRYAQNPTSGIQPTADQLQANNLSDPTKVNQAGQSSNQQQQQDMQGDLGQLRYDSNFQAFVQRLDSTPTLADALNLLAAGRDAAVGANDELAEHLSSAAQAVDLTQDQLVEYLTEQMQAGSRFQGALFSMLRGAYNSASTDNLRNDILQFLKSYLDYASTDHVEGRILREMDQMAEAMPTKWSEQLQDMIGLLKNGVAAGDREGNAAMIRRSVIPLMSQYVDATHDMGLPRRLLSLMTLDLARYENGSEKNVADSFHQLQGYTALKEKLAPVTDQALFKLLRSDAFSSPTAANRFADQLADTAAQALRGTGSAEAQQAFQQLVASMLMNESVYLPVNHYLLPFEQSFADLWVDPNDREGQSGAQSSPGVKVLLQVNTPAMGRFDVVLTTQERNVDVQVVCPDTAAPYSKEIGQSVTQILANSGLNATGVQVKSAQRPLNVSAVFPKIFEGRDSINVKV